jgi:hypothetical protein
MFKADYERVFGMTADEFRRCARALPSASEGAHVGHPDFRVGGKVFATLGADETWGMVKLTPELQALLIRTAPEVFHPASGAWGRRGCTIVQLADANASTVEQALEAAWRLTAPKRLVPEHGHEQSVGTRKSTAAKTRKPPRKRSAAAVTFETVRHLALALPGAEEGTSYGTPAFKVRGKLFIRLHQSGDSLVVKIDQRERELRMRADPETFHITDHYVNHPLLLVRFASLDQSDLRDLIVESWRRSAPQRLLAEYDAS